MQFAYDSLSKGNSKQGQIAIDNNAFCGPAMVHSFLKTSITTTPLLSLKPSLIFRSQFHLFNLLFHLWFFSVVQYRSQVSFAVYLIYSTPTALEMYNCLHKYILFTLNKHIVYLIARIREMFNQT